MNPSFSRSLLLSQRGRRICLSTSTLAATAAVPFHGSGGWVPVSSAKRFRSSASTAGVTGGDRTEDATSPATTTTISASIFKNPIVHELWTARQKAKHELQIKNSRNKSNPQLPVANEDHGKPPKDSYVEVSYPFSTDALLWEAYRNPWGQMRLGRLFEDLDALAGNIAFFHVHSNNSAGSDSSNYPIIVTASVDRIRLRHRPQAGSDQKLSGHVTWTGTSSMEIRMQCTTCETLTTSERSTPQQEWLEAYVTFVTLDPHTKKPMRIPAVVPETKAEKDEFVLGEARAAARKQRRKMHTVTTHSSATSSSINDNAIIDAIANQLMIEAGPLLTMPSLADPHAILLKDTVMQNAMIAQPQSSNLHNRVFGGFLIRRAFELAYSNAYLFGGARPIFLEVDEISFASPVDVGDLLVFYSRILFTENDAGPLRNYYQQDGTNPSESDGSVALMHVEVEAWVTEPEKVSARMSNQFYFTFAVVAKNTSSKIDMESICPPPRVRKVLPSNIDEAKRMATRIHLEQQQKKQFD